MLRINWPFSNIRLRRLRQTTKLDTSKRQTHTHMHRKMYCCNANISHWPLSTIMPIWLIQSISDLLRQYAYIHYICTMYTFAFNAVNRQTIWLVFIDSFHLSICRSVLMLERLYLQNMLNMQVCHGIFINWIYESWRKVFSSIGAQFMLLIRQKPIRLWKISFLNSSTFFAQWWACIRIKSCEIILTMYVPKHCSAAFLLTSRLFSPNNSA